MAPSEFFIKKLMNPSSIAVIGATDAVGKLGKDISENLLASGRQVLLINPSKRELFGRRCYPNISAAISSGETPDLAYIIVPPRNALEILNECNRNSIPAAIVMSSEIEGWSKESASRIKTVFLGPNCLGVHNNISGITFNRSLLEAPGPIVFLSQSGSFTEVFLLAMKRRGIGVAFAVSTGNEYFVGIEDLMEYALRSAEVNCVSLYLEEIRKPEQFFEACDYARRNGKKVIAFKAGITEEGRMAAFSHTGAISGIAQAYAAFLDKCGVIQVESFQELIETCASFECIGNLKGGRIASISGPGGLCVNISDAVSKAGLRQPEFDNALSCKIASSIQGLQSIRNPLDLTMAATSRVRMYGEAAEIIAASGAFDALLIGAPTSYSTREFVQEISRIKETLSLPFAVIWLGETEEIDRAFVNCWKEDIPVFRSAEEAANVLLRLRKVGLEHIASPVFCDRGAGRTLGIEEIIELFSRYGIEFPIAIAHDEQEAVSIAGVIGYPVTAKIYSEEGVHKAKSGLIEFWIRREDELRDAYHRLMSRAVELSLSNPLFTISRQFNISAEFTIGSFSSLQTHIIMFGSGGSMVEFCNRKAYSISPMSMEEASRLISDTNLSNALSANATSQLAALLVNCSRMIAEQHVHEMDINPIIVEGDRPVALDARVRLCA